MSEAAEVGQPLRFDEDQDAPSGAGEGEPRTIDAAGFPICLFKPAYNMCCSVEHRLTMRCR